MYQLINDSKQKIQKYSLSGTIGDIPFDDENVIERSLTLDKQCCDTSTFRLGGCYISQLNITFINVNVPRNDWYGKIITLNVTIGNVTVPVGTFTIEDAKHSKNIVPVVAYNNMAKFDKPCGTDAGTNGLPYDLIALACQMCGVTLGMTRAEVEALPNGNKTLILNTMGDIETWRDYLYWIAVSLCSVAVTNRDGELILWTFHDTIDDTINYDVRFNSSSYGDEIIRYTGITIYVEEENKVEYYHTDPDDGYTLNIGNNPFFQVSKIMREEYAAEILRGLSNIAYNACSAKIPFGFHYDLGDVLQFPNGQGSATNKFCVMGMSLKYNGECVLSGIPGQKNSQSKTDKNLQGLLSTVSKNEFTSYELRNIDKIVIGDNERERIIHARIASNSDTKAQIHIEVNLESEADEGEDVTKGIVSYLINSEEIEFYPTETWIDGKHVLHLMYIMPLDANVLQEFDVYLKSIGGTLTIQRRGVWLYASGAGLVGDGKWDGTLTFIDEVENWTLEEITFSSAIIDTVSAETQVPTGSSLSDTVSSWTLSEITFGSVSDTVLAETHAEVFRMITEAEDILITEDGDVFYTEGD